MNKTILAALIGAMATILAAIIGLYAGKNQEQKIIENQITEVVGNNINIIGDGNEVLINDPVSLANEYIRLKSEYDELQGNNNFLVNENSKYEMQLDEANNRINELQSGTNQEIIDLRDKLEKMPVVVYKDLGLCVDINEIPINNIKSALTVDGRDYFSKEIIERLIPEDKNMTIKDNTIFIGNVIYDPKSLFDMRYMDKFAFNMVDSVTDSYGNNYAHVLCTDSEYRMPFIIYNTDRQYSFLKFTLAINENAYLDKNGHLSIKADDEVVYTSDTLEKKMEPIEIIDIPINKCNLLTIEYSSNFSYFDCIISDAILYN